MPSYNSLKTDLNTYATAAGFTYFAYQYLDEFDPDNRGGTYPAMVVVPFNKPLKTRTDSVNMVTATIEVFVMNEWKYELEGTTERDQVWDALDLKMVTFVQAMNGSGTKFKVLNPDNIESEVYPFGLSTDSSVGIKYTLNVEIYC